MLGTVYGPLLNHPAQWQAALEVGTSAPYAAPPKAPVLYIKPRNCFNSTGTVALPPGATHLMAGASLGLVFMPHVGLNPASVAQAQDTDNLDTLAWLQLAIDWSLPHRAAQGGFYRPPLKFNAHNGFLGMGKQRSVHSLPLADVGQITLAVSVNGHTVLEWSLQHMQRSTPQLLRDVGEFMRFDPLDMLLLGQACLPNGDLPQLGAGDTLRLHSPTHKALGDLVQTVVNT